MKILAVDNHPVMLKFLKSLLEKEGHDVKTADTGLAALTLLKDYLPDVIFLDLIMPKISGKKLCRIIRQKEEFKDTAIVVLSAVAMEEGSDFREFGADVLIAKGPFDKLAPSILSVLKAVEENRIDAVESIRGAEYASQRTITQELIYTKKHFEVILNNMREGIVELTEDGYFIYANPAALKIFDAREEDLLGTRFIDRFDASDRERIQSAFESEGGVQAPLFASDPIVINQRQLVVSLLPVDEGVDTYLLAILIDVTEQKEMEAQLNLAMKMEAIGTLSGGIAHDFNNLLMGIQGNISVMLLDVNPTHPHYEHLKKIQKIVKSGAVLSDKLLGYARKGKYEVRPIDVNQLVVDSSEMFGRTRREITIERDLAENLAPMEGDRVQIEQVLLNLYVNAWQAMPEGGTLRIETRNASQKQVGKIIFGAAPGSYIQLTVSDTGVGIDPKIQNRIFDPFFTTKEIGGGTGLGLASAYGIVKNHNGHIEVASDPGKGSTFYIFFPASKKMVLSKADMVKPDRETETILLVDDEEMALEAGERMLRILGYEVITARNGREGVEVFKETADKVDLVILDMVMPEMGGAQAYPRLKEIRPDVTVLISSGYTMNELPEKISLESSDGFIQKPFDLKQLFHKIRELLDQRPDSPQAGKG